MEKIYRIGLMWNAGINCSYKKWAFEYISSDGSNFATDMQSNKKNLHIVKQIRFRNEDYDEYISQDEAILLFCKAGGKPEIGRKTDKTLDLKFDFSTARLPEESAQGEVRLFNKSSFPAYVLAREVRWESIEAANFLTEDIKQFLLSQKRPEKPELFHVELLDTKTSKICFGDKISFEAAQASMQKWLAKPQGRLRATGRILPVEEK
jgi:hypothetical protein